MSLGRPMFIFFHLFYSCGLHYTFLHSLSSQHLRPRLIIDTDDLARAPFGPTSSQSQSVQLRSTLASLAALNAGHDADSSGKKKKAAKKTLPVIHAFDIHALVLRALLGNDYKPRWCRLKNQQNLAKVVCLVVEDVAYEDWLVEVFGLMSVDRWMCPLKRWMCVH